jgi:catechol 2,3-dioxygenase-like lactoylglutathione lyase family enzyme
MIKQLAHICIHARDLNETLAFYADALGLEPRFAFEKDGERFGCYLHVGNNSFIEVFQGTPGDTGNIEHVAIEVDDLDAVVQRLRAHGLAVDDKKLGADNSWQAWVTDPNGVRIEFHEYTADSRQLTGGTCRVNW